MVYLFVITLVSGIPVWSIIIRYNLVQVGIHPHSRHLQTVILVDVTLCVRGTGRDLLGACREYFRCGSAFRGVNFLLQWVFTQRHRQYCGVFALRTVEFYHSGWVCQLSCRQHHSTLHIYVDARSLSLYRLPLHARDEATICSTMHPSRGEKEEWSYVPSYGDR